MILIHETIAYRYDQTIYPVVLQSVAFPGFFMTVVTNEPPNGTVAVSAAPNDGASHSVQIYSDISAEWASGDDSLTVNWTTTTGTTLTHQVMLETQEEYTEYSDHIQREFGNVRTVCLRVPN